ncbi:major facilitator superfamily domain-containing protein 6-like isoform X2 [Patiria miniata]|uniref:Major facilitator superfamily associated domain-containing protein n=1 Tax=Patiria miniata TaxID=46514 RepID=A0A914BHK5_PATMI|nr:major facilitator superfamily domain-containing protein 6-like isoform X2 [Patiria miniata]
MNGSMASGVFLSLSRTTVVSCGIEHTISDYRVSFLPGIGFYLLALLCALHLTFTYAESPNDAGNQDLLSHVLPVVLSWHYGSVIVLLIFLGICNGAIWGFLYWHLENLGATQSLLGLLIVLHAAVEFLCGSLSGWFIGKCGHIPVLSLGLFFYILRFTAFRLLTVPWHFFFTEILHGMCFILTWTTAVSYFSKSVPPQCGTTMQGLLIATHHGLGVGLGIFSTGLLINRYGAPGTFALYAVSCGLFLIVFVLIQWIAKVPPSPRIRKNDESVKSRPEEDGEPDEQETQETESLLSEPSTPVEEKAKLSIQLPLLKLPTKVVKQQCSGEGK